VTGSQTIMTDDIKNLADLFAALTNLLPGFILLFVRSRFTDGRLPSLKENVALYVVLSAIYFILVPTALQPAPVSNFTWSNYLGRLAELLLLPLCLGILLGIVAQRALVKRAFLWCTTKLGLNIGLADPAPTAWDWKFSRLPACFVIIKLRDGSTVYGRAGPESFISSDPAERDLYIQPIYRLLDNGDWEQSGARGIWIGAGEISTIEFIPEANR